MTQYVNAANLITSTSLALGFVALALAADGHMGAAAVLIVCAAGLDALDGVVARRLSLSGRFGCNLDSLTDMVVFGAAPAFMLHRGPLDAVPVLGAAACVLFVLAGAWRLARFPLVENRRYWVGLPIPAAGLVATGAAAFGVPAVPVLAMTVVAAVLMVSEITIPTAAAVRDAALRRRDGAPPAKARPRSAGPHRAEREADDAERAAALALLPD